MYTSAVNLCLFAYIHTFVRPSKHRTRQRCQSARPFLGRGESWLHRQAEKSIHIYIHFHSLQIHTCISTQLAHIQAQNCSNKQQRRRLPGFFFSLSFFLAWLVPTPGMGRALFFCAIYAITSNLCLPLHIYLLFHSHILLGIVCSVFNTHHAYRVVCNNNECIIPHASQSRLLRQEEAKGPAGSRDCRLRRRRRSLSSRPPFPSSDNHKMAAQPCSIGRLLWLFCSTRKRPAAPKKKKRKEGPTTLCCSPPTSSLPFL